MSNSSSSPFTVQLPPPATKSEVERRAFYRLLPTLLLSHKGQYVAIHEEKVVDAGPIKLEVAMRVLHRVGNVDIFVGLVTDQPEIPSRSGVVRVVEERGSRP
jgi:hypothetical protein